MKPIETWTRNNIRQIATERFYFRRRVVNQYRMQINKKQIVNNHQFAKNITQYLFFVTIIAFP